MKKYCIFIASLLALGSCLKGKVEEIDSTDSFEESEVLNVSQIIGVIEDASTKTSYTDQGDYYEFSWEAGDVVAFQLYKKNDNTHVDQIKYTADSKAASTTFTQQSKYNLSTDSRTYDLGDYAFYPKDRNCDLTYGYNGNKDASSGYVQLHQSITYYPSAPMSMMPLLGKRDRTQEETTLGDGTTSGQAITYNFRSVTGVLKITVKDLPSKATSIKITGGEEDMLSGNFYLSEDLYNDGIYSTMPNAAVKNSYNTKTITFSDQYGEKEFYFPLPAGEITALTVEVFKGETPLKTIRMKAGKKLTIKKGVVTELPAITVPPYYEIDVTGSSLEPTGSFYRENCLTRFAVSSSDQTLAKGSYTEGMKYSDDRVTNTYTLADHFSSVITSSGKYYLHYMICAKVDGHNTLNTMDDSQIVAQSSIPFYYISSADATSRFGQYVLGSSGAIAPAALAEKAEECTISLTYCDDAKKGNMTITEFSGFGYEADYKVNTCVSVTPTADGNPIYGCYSSNAVTFSNTDQQLFFTAGGTGYYLREQSNNDQLRLSFGESSVSAEDAIILYPQGGDAAISIANFSANKVGLDESLSAIDLTAEGYEVIAFAFHGTDTADHLIDGNNATIWHSPYSGSERGDATYGVYVQIKLASPLKTFQLQYVTRSNNANGVPRRFAYWVSNDGESWTQLTDSPRSDIVMKGATATLPPVTYPDGFTYLRIGILKAGRSELADHIMTLSPTSGFTAIAELSLYGKNE